MLAYPLKRIIAELGAGSPRLCSTASEGIRWVFLGPPGVGKGTFASRISESLGIAHIAAGDLMRAIVNEGKLLPDGIVLELLNNRLEAGQARGEHGFILDGLPRTRAQAESLAGIVDIQLAVNLSLREDILITKCLGRRMCKECNKNFNVAAIHFPAEHGKPEVMMPPLMPPAGCVEKMEQRADDTEEVVRRRLQVYHEQADGVERYYREAGLLMDFEIVTGLKETMPALTAALQPYTQQQEQLEQLREAPY